MTSSAPDPRLERQCLSELADGEADADTAARGCASWARDAEARRLAERAGYR